MAAENLKVSPSTLQP